MGIVSEIRKRGLLDPSYPAESPKLELTKEHQKLLNDRKYVIVKDQYYQEEFYVFKKDFNKPLTVDNIEIRSVDHYKMLSNPIRRQELDSFYNRFPKYHR